MQVLKYHIQKEQFIICKKNNCYNLGKVGFNFMPKVFYLGDIVEMKKQHPCGSYQWEIIILGADIKIKCVVCSRILMISRSKLDKDVKKVIKQNIPEE